MPWLAKQPMWPTPPLILHGTSVPGREVGNVPSDFRLAATAMRLAPSYLSSDAKSPSAAHVACPASVIVYVSLQSAEMLRPSNRRNPLALFCSARS